MVYVSSPLFLKDAESTRVIGLFDLKVTDQSLISLFVLFVRISAPLKPEPQSEYSSYLYDSSFSVNETVLEFLIDVIHGNGGWMNHVGGIETIIAQFIEQDFVGREIIEKAPT